MLRIEELEDRRLLAVFAVNNLGDLDGDGEVVVGSLRQAINLSNANGEFDTIIFHDFLFNGPGSGVINLDARDNGGPLKLEEIFGVQIIGPGPGVLTITAAGNNRIFLVDDDSDVVSSSVAISGLTLGNGLPFSGGNPLADDEDGRGGAIFNRESLTLREIEINNAFAPGGGGAIFNDTGVVNLERSLIQQNTSMLGGGGIQNGAADETDNLPTTTIVNSTITGNTSLGFTTDETPTGYGGGVLNLAGTVNIEQSTIYGNSASYDGGGVASQGFDPMGEGEPPTPTVFSGLATTNIRSSIIVGNTVGGGPNDVVSFGMTDDDPPLPFTAQINSQGYNVFGVVIPPGIANTALDTVNVDPTTVFVDSLLHDFGGVLPVFMPDINKSGGLIAIDGGDPFLVSGGNDQRGFQFVRVFDALGVGTPRMDSGAAELQLGNFIVDTLVDESDGRFSNVPVEQGFFPINSISFFPDLSLREALEFGRKNLDSGLPGVSTVGFSDELTDPILNPDPTGNTAAPTFLLTLGELPVDFPVIIQGPAFDLEIDATGNDPTPGVDNGDGSRVFLINDTVTISNLILRGGDRQEFGGAIFTSGDLTLRNTIILDNTTTGTGGGIYVNGGTVLVDATTIHGNLASSSGGGIYVASGDVTVSNSTISGNTGNLHGGGIANADGYLLIRYSTITLNSAGSTFGSGVASFRDASAVTKIRSSIIAGNTINDVQHVMPGAPNIESLDFNLVGDGNAVEAGIFDGGGDQEFTDPMLGPLVKLGGPTPIHRLLPGSPAVDTGDSDPAGLGNVPVFDQRGFPFDRIVGTQIDIGAFEVQNDIFLVGDGSAAEGSYATFVAALTDSNLTPTKETIVFLDTWPGEFFPGGLLEITDSVDILGQGVPGLRFFGLPQLTLLIDDGDSMSLIDVGISGIRFEDNTRVVSLENLTFTDMRFVNNAFSGDGGAISQQNGKLTISDSTFVGNSVSGTGNSGGAIHVLNGDLEINNSFLSGNSTGIVAGKGGAIYIRDGNFTADYLYITGNVAAAATGQGGGIYGRDSTMTLSNAIISGNTTTGSNSEGGGLSAKDSDITLIDSFITFNATYGSQSRGGGIFLDGGSLDIQNGNIFRNKTEGLLSSGGGISSVNADVTITGTSVNDNEVSGVSTHGGGIHAINGDLTIRDSAVINNRASAAGANGGGIFSDTNLTGSQKTTIFNSTISGNTAAFRGGGLYNADGLTEIFYSTITNNKVPYSGDGGGVASYGDSATTLTEVKSTIIAGNNLEPVLAADFNEDLVVSGLDFLAWQLGSGTTSGATLTDGDANSDEAVNPIDLAIWEAEFNSPPLPIDVDRVGGNFDETFVSLGFNVIGGGFSVGAFNLPGDQVDVIDPLLGSLSFNGGRTRNHALLDGSPAIDAGDPSAVAGVGDVPIFDQRGIGFDRVENGRIDVGSFEKQLPDPPAPLAALSVPSAEMEVAPLASQAPSAPTAPIAARSVSSAVRNDPPIVVQVEGITGLELSFSTLSDQVFGRPSFFRPANDFDAAARDASLAQLAGLSRFDNAVSEALAFGDSAATRSEDEDAEERRDEPLVEDRVFDLLGADLL